jgi:hypothetical protein
MWPDQRLVELFETDYPIDRIYQIQESFHGNQLYANATAT